eukprot:5700118-Pleurochrysis_carterae.AAC.1
MAASLGAMTSMWCVAREAWALRHLPPEVAEALKDSCRAVRGASRRVGEELRLSRDNNESESDGTQRTLRRVRSTSDPLLSRARRGIGRRLPCTFECVRRFRRRGQSTAEHSPGHCDAG